MSRRRHGTRVANVVTAAALLVLGLAWLWYVRHGPEEEPPEVAPVPAPEAVGATGFPWGRDGGYEGEGIGPNGAP